MGRSSHRWVSGSSAKPVSRTMPNSDGKIFPSMGKRLLSQTSFPNHVKQRWGVPPIAVRALVQNYHKAERPCPAMGSLSHRWEPSDVNLPPSDGKLVPIDGAGQLDHGSGLAIYPAMVYFTHAWVTDPGIPESCHPAMGRSSHRWNALTQRWEALPIDGNPAMGRLNHRWLGMTVASHLRLILSLFESQPPTQRWEASTHRWVGVTHDKIKGNENGGIDGKDNGGGESKNAKKKKKKPKEAKEQRNGVEVVDDKTGVEKEEAEDAVGVDVKEKIKKVQSMRIKKSSKEMDAAAKAAASEAAARRAKVAAATKKKEKNHYNQQPLR
ncbi:hypothetical protein DM860_004174 [Cuscuta australis]|uniref:Uncharacterized protein n=1 Tax=Cuscuta australis TaxID=267555 RepID=A0A328CVC5_9ASTE|nr:hypothetical protein DM860_004174 [Cuscuta australis]